MPKNKSKGWRGQSKRHAKSAKGIKTGRKIGTSWKSKKYIHGPRIRSPSKYSEFRLGKPTKEGKRFVFGKIRGTNKWEMQSKLTPINYGMFFDIFGKKEKKKDTVAISLPGGTPLKFTKEEKEKFKIKEENFGDWTDIKKFQLEQESLKQIKQNRDQWLQAKGIRKAFRKSKEKQMRLV